MSEIYINKDWPEFKAIADLRPDLPVRVRVDEDNREGFITIGDLKYRTFIRDNENGWGDELDSYSDNISNSVSEIHQKLETTGKALWLTSHDYGNPSSWWPYSAISENEIAVQTGTYTWTVVGADQNGKAWVIDLWYGEIFRWHDIVGHPHSINPIDTTPWFPDGNYLDPVVTANGQTLTRVSQKNAAPGTGEYDYDGESGVFTFGDDWAATPPVISYHYAVHSRFDFLPLSGKMFLIGYSEVNTRNIDVNSASIFFDVTVGETIVDRRIYDSETSVIVASVDLPRVWREREVFKWPYDQVQSPAEDVRIRIKSSLNMSVKLATFDTRDAQSPLIEDQMYLPYDENGSKAQTIITIYAVSFSE
jgi:hypothetical protein